MIKMNKTDLTVAIVLMLVLAVLILPVPLPLLDAMLVMSIAMGALVLFITLQLHNPLQLSAFPSLLLLLTLFRLSLNVATTRQILLNGYAGRVIQSFGDFVVGGSYVVGVIIFLILVIINFMVITKGSGRIAEVAARFTLDAMPGKQMSIDADLNAGLIDERQALRRREELSEEADFYGAMDGASKFVRGDAVAGLIITAINIVGGFAIGMLQMGMSAGEALQRFTILTVGDGLLSQIPALIISIAAGMLVTRASTGQSMGEDLKIQLFLKPKPLLTTAGLLCCMGLVPGLPLVPFVGMGALMGGIGYAMRGQKDEGEEAAGGAVGALGGGAKAKALAGRDGKALPEKEERAIPEISAMDVEIGFGLVPLVDRGQGGKMLDRIASIRQQLAEELGFVLPPVNVHDNMRLRNNEYALRIRGREVARGVLQPGQWLAVDPSGKAPFSVGLPVQEPTFGFKAWWINAAQRELAEAKGLTVVDPTDVLTTHVTETARNHAADLLVRQDVSELIDRVKRKHESVVQELIPGRLSLGVVHRVLQNLVRERVSIRDLPLILETLADHAGRTQDPALLTELCRRALGAYLTGQYLEPGGKLPAIALHPDVEGMLKDSIHRENGDLGVLALPPDQNRAVLDGVARVVGAARKGGRHPVLVCLPTLRRHLRRLLEPQIRDLPILSFAEIPDSIDIDIMGLVSIPMVKNKEVA
jgi:flagellar biosynthesis protein FlhA